MQSIVERAAAKALTAYKMAFSRYYRTGKNLTDVKHYAEKFGIYNDLLVAAKTGTKLSLEIIEATKLEIITLIDDEVQQMAFDVDSTQV